MEFHIVVYLSMMRFVFVCTCDARYGFSEINLGVGLNTLAMEGSYENSFLSIFEEKFTADVSRYLVNL